MEGRQLVAVLLSALADRQRPALPSPLSRWDERLPWLDAANSRWLHSAFEVAAQSHARAVVIGLQADMWDPAQIANGEGLNQYTPFVQQLAYEATAFGGPVLMFNGDSHVYKSDNPLSASDPLNPLHPGYDVPNFHRVVVHGSTAPLEWLLLTIDTHDNGSGDSAFGPFSWTRVQP